MQVFSLGSYTYFKDLARKLRSIRRLQGGGGDFVNQINSLRSAYNALRLTTIVVLALEIAYFIISIVFIVKAPLFITTPRLGQNITLAAMSVLSSLNTIVEEAHAPRDQRDLRILRSRNQLRVAHPIHQSSTKEAPPIALTNDQSLSDPHLDVIPPRRSLERWTRRVAGGVRSRSLSELEFCAGISVELKLSRGEYFPADVEVRLALRGCTFSFRGVRDVPFLLSFVILLQFCILFFASRRLSSVFPSRRTRERSRLNREARYEKSESEYVVNLAAYRSFELCRARMCFARTVRRRIV